MSAQPIPILVKCQFEGGALSVGDKRTLTCDFGKTLAPTAKPEFVDANTDAKFEIQFLGPAQVQGSSVSQVFTSYKVGQLNLKQIKVKNIDDQEYLVSPQMLDVKSIVQGSPTPFPVVTPESVPIPLWWWAIWLVLFLILSFFAVRKYLQSKKKKAAAQKIAAEQNLTPLQKFQAKMRKLDSKGLHLRGEYKAFAVELTLIVKKAVGEELAFAAEDLTSEEFLATLQRRHKAFYNSIGNSLSKFLEDLDQIKFAKVETSSERCSQLLDAGTRIGNALFGRNG